MICRKDRGARTPVWQGYRDWCNFEGDEHDDKKYLSFKRNKLYLFCVKIKPEFVFEDKLKQQILYLIKMNPKFCDGWVDDAAQMTRTLG